MFSALKTIISDRTNRPQQSEKQDINDGFHKSSAAAETPTPGSSATQNMENEHGIVTSARKLSLKTGTTSDESHDGHDSSASHTWHLKQCGFPLGWHYNFASTCDKWLTKVLPQVFR